MDEDAEPYELHGRTGGKHIMASKEVLDGAGGLDFVLSVGKNRLSFGVVAFMIFHEVMKHSAFFRSALVGMLGWMAMLLVPSSVEASYFALTRDTKDDQQCITYDVRYPYWTEHIYIATYPGHSRSKEGWIAPYYGGVVGNLRGEPTLIQYASWQMGGKGAPTSGIDFVHAGKHMSWVRSTWEGSSGGIKGLWPQSEFKTNEWYRFVNRVWTPVKATPHLGYAGVWMKNLKTNEWFHLATFKFPAELTGFNAMGGFCEYVTGNATKTCAAEFRNVYAMRHDQWGSESEFSAFNHKEDIIRLIQPANKSSVLLETTRTPQDPTTGKYEQTPVVTQKVALTQPEKPAFFDPVKVSSPSAGVNGSRVVVKWRVDVKNSPQLGYVVDLLEGEKVVATSAENDPNARECVLEVGEDLKRLQARVRITDLFGRNSAAVTVPVVRLEPMAAVKEPTLAAGLVYRYVESAKPADWQAIPEMTKLVAKREGVVAGPDLTPRLSRTGYAFTFSGYLRVPKTGLYAFHLISACGAKLILDGKTVVNADGYHSIAKTPGTVALAEGLHTLVLPYFQGARQYQQADDFLQLTWSGPGLAEQPVPFSAFSHERAGGDALPEVALKVAQQGDDGINLLLSCEIKSGQDPVERVEYYATNAGFDYYSAQGACGAEYFLAESKTPSESVPAVIWGGGGMIRARVIYQNGKTIDSPPFLLGKGSADAGGVYGDYRLTQLEHHLYPMACSADAQSITLVGESMGLLTKPVTGDATVVARVADITSAKRQADGTELMDAQNWYAGVIVRESLEARPGEPLGGSQIPYASLMVAANGQTRHCDSTMINGAGNQPAGVGNGLPWLKIERKGADFTLSASADGQTWKQVKTVNLPKMPANAHVGFVIYAIPSATNRVHWAKFDHISITQ